MKPTSSCFGGTRVSVLETEPMLARAFASRWFAMVIDFVARRPDGFLFSTSSGSPQTSGPEKPVDALSLGVGSPHAPESEAGKDSLESPSPHAPVVQLEERAPCKGEAPGSVPGGGSSSPIVALGPADDCDHCSCVEHEGAGCCFCDFASDVEASS